MSLDVERPAPEPWVPGAGPALSDPSGRVAVITGGASGIGRGIAQRLAEAGMTVVISDLDRPDLAATAADLGVAAVPADVTDPGAVAALAAEVEARYGGVDVVVNNAGVGPMSLVKDLTLDDWRWMIDVNLFGVVHGIQAFLPLLLSNARGGYLVNTASMAGLTSIPATGMAAYVAGKMAVVGVTEVLAQELAAEGASVGVSVLCPGPVRSRIGEGLRARPAGASGALRDVDAESDGPLAGMRWMDPLDVGTLVLDGMREGRTYLITHPELWHNVGVRFAAIAGAFGVSARWGQARMNPDGERGRRGAVTTGRRER